MSPEENRLHLEFLLFGFLCSLLTLPHPFEPFLLLMQHLAYTALDIFKCADLDEPATTQGAQILLMTVVEVQGKEATMMQFSGVNDTVQQRVIRG